MAINHPFFPCFLRHSFLRKSTQNMKTSSAAVTKDQPSRRRKRSAVKCKKAIVFSDSESDSDINMAAYRELKTDWTRLRREVNNGRRMGRGFEGEVRF